MDEMTEAHAVIGQMYLQLRRNDMLIKKLLAAQGKAEQKEKPLDEPPRT